MKILKKVSQKILKINFKKIIKKSVPLWLVIVLMFESMLGAALIEAYIVKKTYNDNIQQLASTTKNSDQLIQILKQRVLPQTGFTLAVTWQDIGKQLLQTGVINKEKYEENFAQEPDSREMMKYLMTDSQNHMTINEKNSHFMVNTLWAIGLVNKSKILDEGQMKTYGQADPMQYASTGGWTLGTKETSELYSSAPLIELTDKQEELVGKIAANIFRPCCGNPTSFPDCNHGMAALGYIELAVKQGVSEKRIYQDLLALNSFWFPQQYVNMAVFFSQQKTGWKNVDAKIALGQQYSSAQGAQQVQQSIQNVPGIGSQGGGCGA